ncbi:MAG: septal ring lytic transglycosylase RlpA family protein [Ignavibacteria bacterium]|jgi:rare lipoprotein A|nr:septal ring lytic transglycosylase RlpA family protein [Ignavibacteria bacterium]
MLKKIGCIIAIVLLSFTLLSWSVAPTANYVAYAAIFESNTDKQELATPTLLADTNLQDYLVTDEGKSSHYAHKFHNRRTASGELFDMYGYTAAHKKLPFGTIVKVLNPNSQQAILVRINDRGPFVKKRIIDLSYRAGKSIGALGTPNICLQYFDNQKVTEKLDTSYLLGYSADNPFIVVKKSYTETLKEETDFEAAMNYLNSIADTTKDCYLFIEAAKTERNPNYIVGVIKSISVAKK